MDDARKSDKTSHEGADAGFSIFPEQVIEIESMVRAVPEVVWAAWADPKHIDQWWGPNGFRNQTVSMDFRVGGEWRYIMHGPDGTDWHNWIRYEEIAPAERLVYSHGSGDSDAPLFHVVVTFEAQGSETRVYMRSSVPSVEACTRVKNYRAIEGGAQTLARLAGHVPCIADGSADATMVLTRLLDAPVPQVFPAWSTPERLMGWWGPTHFTLPTCDVDFRPGGAYRMVMRDPLGNDYPFHGHYRDIVPNQRIVFDAEIMDGVEVLTTVTFSDEDGKTRLTVQQTIPDDADAAAGQREGWNGSLEKLAAHLAAQQAY